MKNLILFVYFFLAQFSSFSQSESSQLIKEGVALHDNGEYEKAILKYDQVLATEPDNYEALYEKGFSLMELKKYEEAIRIYKKILKECKMEKYRKGVYVNYGTVYDYMGEPGKSISIYDKGLKEFPDYYLIHFNKAITLNSLSETEKSIQSFKNAVKCNPAHASSHNGLARSYYATNRIASLLAFAAFLLVEPMGERASQNYKLLNELLGRGVKKVDDKNTTITLSLDDLNPKGKAKEDNFRSTELMLSLMTANNSLADSLGAQTEADRLDLKLQFLISSLSETNHSGFFSTYYIPMFKEMKQKNLTKTASYIIMASANDEAVNQWLKDNESLVEEFYKWFREYKWTK